MILIKAQRDALLRPLQMVSGIVERRHTLPILSNVLIKKNGANVSLISTDIEMQITSTVEMGSGTEETATTVSARKLLDILRALPNDNEVVVSMAGRKMSISQGKSRFQLQTLAAEEFPTVTPAQTYPAKVSLSQKDFKQLLHLVHFSMAQQDIRYYLNGLLLVIESDQLRAVATDGHRLAYAAMSTSETTEISSDTERLEVIVPRKAIKPLDLDKKDPTAVIDHGDVWIQRVRRLKSINCMPEKFIFAVRYPKDDKCMDAAHKISQGLYDEGVVWVRDNEKELLDAVMYS